MVLPGQYLERPTLIARGDGESTVTLEGLYHRGQRAPGLVVCAPHPRMGGSMDSAVVAELAWAFTRRGHATLRFNYQGVGASGGTVQAPLPEATHLPVTDLEAEAQDALAAATHLAQSIPSGRVALAGYSFGAAVALAVAIRQPAFVPLVLVAPPTRLFDFSPLATLDAPVFVAAGTLDPFVELPVLQSLATARPSLRLHPVEGAEHAFTRGLTGLGREAADWLAATSRS